MDLGLGMGAGSAEEGCGGQAWSQPSSLFLPQPPPNPNTASTQLCVQTHIFHAFLCSLRSFEPQSHSTLMSCLVDIHISLPPTLDAPARHVAWLDTSVFVTWLLHPGRTGCSVTIGHSQYLFGMRLEEKNTF